LVKHIKSKHEDNVNQKLRKRAAQYPPTMFDKDDDYEEPEEDQYLQQARTPTKYQRIARDIELSDVEQEQKQLPHQYESPKATFEHNCNYSPEQNQNKY
jgi:hypothetical protein